MKKLLLLGIVATLLTLGASAQNRKPDFNKDGRSPDRQQMMNRGDGDHRTHSLTRGERSKIRHNAADYQRAKHRAYRDGKFSKYEQRKLHKMKKHNRHQAFHYKHNRRG
ncbi:MAG: hypothetical protein ABWZ25_05735 [Chitinophagaceae bacterium]